jgi:hypothetical protein
MKMRGFWFLRMRIINKDFEKEDVVRIDKANMVFGIKFGFMKILSLLYIERECYKVNWEIKDN